MLHLSLLYGTLLVASALLSPVLATSAQQATVWARTVLAAVLDQQGRPIVDLAIDDFVVAEGDTPREVLDVHVADYPVALVVDDRVDSGASLAAIRAATQRFVQRVGERPVALLRLTDGTRPMVELEDDRLTVIERLTSLSTAGDAETPPLDTIAAAAALLKKSGAPFSAVVVVAGGPVDATALVRGELLPQILESGASVHVVQVQGADRAAAAAPDDDLLRVVAEQSHGQFTTVYSSASLPAALDRLADRLAVEMMVRYLVPEGPRVGDAKVGVRVPGGLVVGLGVR